MLLRSLSQADGSLRSNSMLSILLDRHWRVITFSFISVISSHLLCLGVYCISSFLMIRRTSSGGNALYNEEALWVFKLSITRINFSLSGYITSTRYLISSAQSIAVQCSRTLTWCLPASASIKANMPNSAFYPSLLSTQQWRYGKPKPYINTDRRFVFSEKRKWAPVFSGPK